MWLFELVFIGYLLGRPVLWIQLVIVDELESLTQRAASMGNPRGLQIAVLEVIRGFAFQGQRSLLRLVRCRLRCLTVLDALNLRQI